MADPINIVVIVVVIARIISALQCPRGRSAGQGTIVNIFQMWVWCGVPGNSQVLGQGLPLVVVSLRGRERKQEQGGQGGVTGGGGEGGRGGGMSSHLPALPPLGAQVPDNCV